MKYLALLRGVNVGGKGTISMDQLKDAFVKAGFHNVSTYINSGNILFESDEKDVKHLTKEVEALLEKTFFAIKTVVLSHKELQDVVDHIPHTWKHEDLRKYIAFVKSPSQPDDVIQEAQLKEGIDFIEKGRNVAYMSTKMSGLTKSSFPKLATKKIYQDMTIRNYTTVAKLFSLMEKN